MQDLSSITALLRRGLGRCLVLLAGLLAAAPLAAQAQSGGVGIGTTAPDVSAALDIVSSTKGALLPRVADATALATPATGLLVFQTGGTPGFYYNAGTPAAPSWQQIATAAGDNLGNHTATQDLNLQGNALVGTGSSVGSAVGVGVRADGGLNLGENNSDNVYLGYQAGDVSNSFNNVFVGSQAGLVNTGGFNNVYLGTRSGVASTTAFDNVFSGHQSGRGTTTGSYNVFSGTFSGRNNTTGSSNTALGYGSGPALGSGALTNATALGANVTLTTSNTVVLGNGASVGIGTPAPSQKLEVAGQVFSNVGGFRFPDNTVQTTAATTTTASNGLTSTGNNVALGGTLTQATSIAQAGNTFGLTGGSVGIGTTTPDASAVLEVSSTTQGLLPPRLTASQRAAIAAPATGLLVFQTDGSQGIYYYTGLAWVNLTNGRVPDASGSTVPANAAVVSTLAGSAGSPGSADGPGAAARFYTPIGVALDAAGTVYVADQSNHTIRKITPAGVVSTLAGLAGSRGSTDGTGTSARFYVPNGVAVDAAGTVYVADTFNHTIRKITPAGVVSTLAGSAGSSGSTDGPGAAARFNLPRGVAVDAAGTVYVADASNHTIRKITAAGVVSTLAGTAGSSGSADGTGAAARLNSPIGVAVDAAGTVYVADQSNNTIRKITPAGVASTLAGSAGSSGSADGTGAAARFYFPNGVALDAAGTVYVADTFNHTIRRVTPAGVVSTLAGSAGSTGSADGTGTSARFNYPNGVAVDAAGTVYVADANNHTIRVIK
ncbi:MAG: hypothetical protein ACRYFZ_10605 [Janthinobacterium lividum]